MADDDFPENPFYREQLEARLAKKYRCHSCPYVETGNPIQWCKRCSEDYLELQELAKQIESRRGFLHRDAAPNIKRELNLLIGEINELRRKVKRLER